MFFFAFVVHVGTVLGVFAFGASAQEVVVVIVDAAYALNVSHNIEVERQVVPKCAREPDALFFDVTATIQLVPRRIQKLSVEKLAGICAEFFLRFEDAIGRITQLAIVLAFVVIVRVDGKAGNKKVEVVLGGNEVHVLQHGAVAPIVSVHEVQVIATSNFDSGVACGGGSLVFLVDYADTHIVIGKFVAQSATAIGASIVYQQNLVAGACLILQRANGTTQPGFYVVDRNNDAYRGTV